MAIEKIVDARALRTEGIDPEYFSLVASYLSPAVHGVRWDNARDSFAIAFEGEAAELDRLLAAARARIGKTSLKGATHVLWSRQAGGAGGQGTWPEMLRRGVVRDFGSGHVAYGGPLLALVDRLDAVFLVAADAWRAERFHFPNAVALETLRRLGTFDHYPQYVYFVAPLRSGLQEIEDFQRRAAQGDPPIHGALAAPAHGLRTSACAPIYAMLESADAPAARFFTTIATCTRNEASNVTTLERLTEFQMREIVYVGDAAGVEPFRRDVLRLLRDLMECFDLPGAISTARDAFFLSNYDRYGLSQLLGGDKLEARVAIPESGAEIAVASFNNHRNFFSRRFHFTVRGQVATSACVGFGLERLAYAILSRHGLDASLDGEFRDLVARIGSAGGGARLPTAPERT